MINICSFSDIHIGIKTYGKIDPITGLNTREIHALDVLDEVVNSAINNKRDILLFAGDAYKNNLPSPTIQDEFNKRIKKAADHGITCLILDGNHDVSKMNTTSSAMKQFDTLGVKNVIHTRFHKEYIYKKGNEKIKFVFLPTYHTEDEIKDIVDNTTYDGFPIIYIGHLTLTSAYLNDYMVAEKEVSVDYSIFKKEGVLAVDCGHLHKFQVLNNLPLIFYNGSTQRVDFNEENQPKGYVDLFVDAINETIDYKFCEVNTQKFYTLKIDLKEKQDGTQLVIDELERNKERIENAIVRIICETNDNTILNSKDVYDYLLTLNPTHMLDIQRIKDLSEHKRNTGINENTNIYNSLELYYKGKIREKERIELGKQIIEEVNNNEQ